MSIYRKFMVHAFFILMLFVGVSSAAAAPARAAGNTQISGVGVYVSTAECPDRPSPYYPPSKWREASLAVGTPTRWRSLTTQ